MRAAVIGVSVVFFLSSGIVGAFLIGRRKIQTPTPEAGWRRWDDDENDPWTE